MESGLEIYSGATPMALQYGAMSMIDRLGMAWTNRKRQRERGSSVELIVG